MEYQIVLDKVMSIASNYGVKVIGAIVIWIVGSWAIKKLMKAANSLMDKSHYDESLKKFLLNLTSIVLKVLLVLSILGNLGIETTSFAAVLASAGLAIGLALQGSLANFAGGVMLMIFKPFKIGDFIEAQGKIGVVKEIEIFTTKIVGPGNHLIIIPNGILSNGSITNYTDQDTRQVRHVIGVSYDADIKKAKEVLLKVLTLQEKVLKDPPPSIEVVELADSSVNFAVRGWVKTEDYWGVHCTTLEHAKIALDEAGIEIPYPHSVEIQK
ncbi:MAG: small conductance mechanosensitive channel [Candidatus Paceibacteria bacterium]|jgi:small conductance mechanosensitive channel